MGNWFQKKPDPPTDAQQEKRREKLPPNHGVDVQEIEELGETMSSRALKEIMQAMAAMKMQRND